MSTTNLSQFLDISSLYRNIDQWPLPTDFSVTFKTYTGPLNVVNGEPLSPNDFFSPVSIDPDFSNNNIQLNGCRIGRTYYDETNGCMYLSGISNSSPSFIEVVIEDVTVFSSILSTVGNSAFILKLTRVPRLNNIETWDFNWIVYSTSSSGSQLCTDATFQQDSLGNIYFLFDFESSQMTLRYKDSSISTVLYNSITNPTSTSNISKVLILFYLSPEGFAARFANHDWGYHFIYSQNFDMQSTKENGKFDLRVDPSNNVYINGNVNPFLPKRNDIYLNTAITSRGVPIPLSSASPRELYSATGGFQIIPVMYNIAEAQRPTYLGTFNSDPFTFNGIATGPFYQETGPVYPGYASAGYAYMNSVPTKFDYIQTGSRYYCVAGNRWIFGSTGPLSYTYQPFKVYDIDPTTPKITELATGPRINPNQNVGAEIFNQNIYIGAKEQTGSFMQVYRFDTTTNALTLRTQTAGIVNSAYANLTSIWAWQQSGYINYFEAIGSNAGPVPNYQGGVIFGSGDRNITGATGAIYRYDIGANTLTRTSLFSIPNNMSVNGTIFRNWQDRILFFSVQLSDPNINIYDFSNPSGPQLLSTLVFGGPSAWPFCYSRTVGSIRRDFMSIGSGFEPDIQIFNIQDPSNPQIIEPNVSPILGYTYNADVRNRYYQSFFYVSSTGSLNWYEGQTQPVLANDVIISSHANLNDQNTTGATGARSFTTFNSSTGAFLTVANQQAIYTYGINTIKTLSQYSVQNFTFNTGPTQTLSNTVNSVQFVYFLDGLNVRIFSYTNGLYTLVQTITGASVYRFGCVYELNQKWFLILGRGSTIEKYRWNGTSFALLNSVTNPLGSPWTAGAQRFYPELSFNVLIVYGNFALDPFNQTYIVLYDITADASITQYLQVLFRGLTPVSAQGLTFSELGQDIALFWRNANGALYAYDFTFPSFQEVSFIVSITSQDFSPNNPVGQLVINDKRYSLSTRTNQPQGSDVFNLVIEDFTSATYPLAIAYNDINYSLSANGFYQIGTNSFGDITQGILLSDSAIYLLDLTDPNYAVNDTTTFATVSYTGTQSFGSCIIHKIQQSGQPLWMDMIGTDISQQPYGQLANITNVEIDPTNNLIYASGGWKDKLQIYTTSSTGFVLSNQVDNTSNPDNFYNGFVLRINSLNGSIDWDVPLIGIGDTFVQQIRWLQANNQLYIGAWARNLFNIYARQLGGSLVNPTAVQATLFASSNSSSFLFNLSSAGTYSWSSVLKSILSNVDVRLTTIESVNGRIIATGISDANEIIGTDGAGAAIQTLYSNATGSNANPYPIVYMYEFDNSGKYLLSDKIVTENVNIGSINSMAIVPNLNSIYFGFNPWPQNTNQYAQFYNKDGTLFFTENYTGTTFYGNATRYLYNSSYTDSNNKQYSQIVFATGPSYPFTGGAFTNYSCYVLGQPDDPSINRSFSVRTNYQNIDSYYEDKNNIVLNQVIATNGLDRRFSLINGITGSDGFYAANLSKAPLAAMATYTYLGGNNIEITSFTPLDLTKTIFITYPRIIPPATTPVIQIVPITSITQTGFTTYTATVSDINLLKSPPGGPLYGPYIYLNYQNVSVTYKLNFFPASIRSPVYYTMQILSIQLPNRPLRNINDRFGGQRTYNDIPYIYVSVYNTDDNDNYDPEIVNLVFDNNPLTVQPYPLFRISVNETSSTANFARFSADTVPRIKFSPNFFNLRIRIFDPYGNILLFDDGATKVADTTFTDGVVPEELLNVYIKIKLDFQSAQ